MLLYLARLTFRNEGQKKNFPDKKKLKESSSPNHYYMKCYRDLFQKKNIKTMNNKMAINTYFNN